MDAIGTDYSIGEGAFAGKMFCPNCRAKLAYFNADKVTDDLSAMLATREKWNVFTTDDGQDGRRRFALQAVDSTDEDRDDQGVRFVLARVGEMFYCPDCAHEFIGADAADFSGPSPASLN